MSNGVTLGPTIVATAPKAAPKPAGNFPSGGSAHMKPATSKPITYRPQ